MAPQWTVWSLGCYLHNAVADPGRVHRYRHPRVVQAGAGTEVEHLLVQRGGERGPVASGTHDATGQHERAGERVAVVYGVHRPVEGTEQGDLSRAEQRGGSPLRQQLLVPAHRLEYSHRATCSRTGR